MSDVRLSYGKDCNVEEFAKELQLINLPAIFRYWLSWWLFDKAFWQLQRLLVLGLPVGYSRTNRNRGVVEDTLFWKTLLEFFIFLRYPGNSRQNKAQSWIFHKIVLHLLEIPRPKTKTPLAVLKFHITFSWFGHLGNSASFLISTWKFHVLFLWYPWKFHILNPCVWIFSWIAQWPLTNRYFLSAVCN